MISLHLTILPREMSQFIAQMFQAALLSFRYPSFTGKPEQTPSPLKHDLREKGRWRGGVTSVVRSSSSSWLNN